MYSSAAWVTKEYADQFLKDNTFVQFASVTLGVTLHRPANVEQQAMDILEDAGMNQIPFTTNLAYNDGRRRLIKEETSTYYFILIFILFCGFIMYALLMPKLISGQDHIAFVFLKIWPFLIATLFCFITVLMACMLPASYADRVPPAEAMD